MSPIWYLSVIALSLFGTEARLSSEQLAEIDEMIETLVIPANMVSGFGIGIVDGGEVVHAKGFGYRNVSAGLPVEDNSLFLVGSVSKVGRLRQLRLNNIHLPSRQVL